MTPVNLRFISALTAVVFGLLLLAPHVERGEDAYQALAEYAPYMPGNAIPFDVNCDSFAGFHDGTQMVCRLPGGSYCHHGFIVVQSGIIVQTSFFECTFPLAYLTAQNGRYSQVRQYRKTFIVRWPNVTAHIRRVGWLHAMQPVHIVTWWQNTPATPPRFSGV